MPKRAVSLDLENPRTQSAAAAAAAPAAVAATNAWHHIHRLGNWQRSCGGRCARPRRTFVLLLLACVLLFAATGAIGEVRAAGKKLVRHLYYGYDPMLLGRWEQGAGQGARQGDDAICVPPPGTFSTSVVACARSGQRARTRAHEGFRQIVEHYAQHACCRRHVDSGRAVRCTALFWRQSQLCPPPFRFDACRNSRRFPSPSCCAGGACAAPRTGRTAVLTLVRSDNHLPLLQQLECTLRRSNPGVEFGVLMVPGELGAEALAWMERKNLTRLEVPPLYYPNAFNPR